MGHLRAPGENSNCGPNCIAMAPQLGTIRGPFWKPHGIPAGSPVGAHVKPNVIPATIPMGPKWGPKGQRARARAPVLQRWGFRWGPDYIL